MFIRIQSYMSSRYLHQWAECSEGGREGPAPTLKTHKQKHKPYIHIKSMSVVHPHYTHN